MKYALLLLMLVTHSVLAQEVNVYSARKEALIKPLLDEFSAQTGIKVNLVTGKADALLSRIQNEGEFSPADLLLTTDVGRLVRAKALGLTQATDIPEVAAVVPANLRDEQGHWVSLTLRARPIMYAADRVDPAALSRMEDLAKPEWKGRVCVRSSNNIYNQSLVAAMLSQVGEQQTLQWAKGLVSNFARDPKGGDRDQIKAVAAGQCDVAIANTYYLAGMLTSSDSTARELAQQVKVLWPNQQDRGAHINVSGATVLKHAPNAALAHQLLAFMLTENSQAWYATANHEYPVREGVEWSDVLQSFGTFKGEEIALPEVGERNAQAVTLMDKAGWR
ncbi:Fe(3+) ABC transporter substrate-binding protein [Aestuariibacter halophilus]|uniref:Fe(3+) ABC transporter substrate-binding protein n=1 Tax=Fluctibacter halophilus TaxID=226011 RepID=A0ABS8G3Z9_9ALTE|nr:Fe(3+) ABC transporter substrate-binding protein [Aestuariibacter halophilus]MCC2615203.1 Fe(3+) ABC transporter substrate-binding protein [Aestuariibacter halophilus]